jgi:CDGSH-type Zn-finger protein
MADITIEIIKNGPYTVNGRVELEDPSTSKRFCAGTHSKIGFQTAEQAVPGSAEG